MNPSPAAVAVVVGVLMLSSVTAVAGPPAPVKTSVTLLFGFPSGQEPSQASDLSLPGTVVLPGFNLSGMDGRISKLSERIKQAYGFARVEAGVPLLLVLEPGQEHEINTPAAQVDVRLTLLASDEEKAVYRVALLEGGRLLGDPRITVAHGQSGIVGARDGEAAPFVFLVLRPDPAPRLKTPDGGTIFAEPKLVHQVPPRYPAEARKARTTGVVVLELRVDREGRVADVRVLRELENGCTEAAVEAATQWRYEPARLPSGEATEALFTVTIRFRLE